MRLIKILLVVALLWLPMNSMLRSAVTFAQDNDVRINLLLEDEYVIRSMNMIKDSGEKIPNLIMIESFGRDSKAFVVEDIYGEQKEIPVSEIKKIRFKQLVKRQDPTAQMAAWKIITHKREQKRIEVLVDQLYIESGFLVLKNLGIPRLLGDGDVLEVLNISVNPSKDRFSLDIQNVKYEKEYYGSGGFPGFRKEIQ